MTAINNNNPDVYWLNGGTTNAMQVGDELWMVGMQATTWGANSVLFRTGPTAAGPWTTVHTFSANGFYIARFNAPGAKCWVSFLSSPATPTGCRQSIGRVPEADTSDTISTSITGGGTGLTVAAPVDGGSYTLAGTVTGAATALNLKIQLFEDVIANLPTAILPINAGGSVPVGAFSFPGIRLPKCSSIVIQAVNTASGVTGLSLTKDIGDNRRCESNTIRNVAATATNPINFGNRLCMFLADASTWTANTVALEADLGAGYVSIAPDLDNTRAPAITNVVGTPGVTVPFRFHPSALISGLTVAYGEIPLDADEDAPQGTLNTANGTTVLKDIQGGTYDMGFSVSHGTAGNSTVVFNWTPHGAVAGSNLTVALATFVNANNAGGDGFGNYTNVVQCPPGQMQVTSSNGAVSVSLSGSQSLGCQRTQGD